MVARRGEVAGRWRKLKCIRQVVTGARGRGAFRKRTSRSGAPAKTITRGRRRDMGYGLWAMGALAPRRVPREEADLMSIPQPSVAQGTRSVRQVREEPRAARLHTRPRADRHVLSAGARGHTDKAFRRTNRGTTANSRRTVQRHRTNSCCILIGGIHNGSVRRTILCV